MKSIAKNVLIVAHHYPPHITGVGMIAHHQAIRLAASGHSVTVVTSDTSPEEKSHLKDGVRVIRIKAWNISENWDAPFPIFSPHLLPVLLRCVKNADVVHIHDAFYMSSFLAALCARWYKKPLVLTQHISLIDHPSNIVVAIEKLTYATSGAIVFQLSDLIFTYNDRVERFLIGRGVPQSKLATLTNGVDPDLFHLPSREEKVSLRSHFGLSQTKKIILFVGRFVPKKGFDKVFAARSKDYQIVFVGGDPLQKNTEEAVFLGKISQAEIAQAYRAADIFILPSESEGFPLAVQEAMASGLPIITTNDEGYASYHLDKKMVVMIDHPTEHSVREAIASIIHDDARQQAMALYSKKYADEYFSWPAAITKLDRFYNGVLAKKIAIVSDAIYPFNKGGKETRLHDISTRLVKDGYQVTIYCMQWWKGGKTLMRDGVRFYAISPYYLLYAKQRRSISEAIFFSLHTLKMLFRDFDIIDIDHMPHLVLFPMRIVCWLKGKRMIVTWHEVWGMAYWQEYLGIAGVIAYILEKWSAKLPDVIISVSDHTTQDLRTILKTKRHIITIPNGLDINTIKSVPASDRASDIIFAGRLLSHKNVDVLLRAVALLQKKIPHISLSIVGDGPEQENLERLTAQLGMQKNISFFGFLEDHREVYALMRASRVFVLPSTREGFGIAVIEANACGLPVITIDDEHNAAKELIIKSENGTLCALDSKKLAEAIEKMLTTRKDPEFYIPYAQKYDWPHLIAEMENVYTSHE